LALQHLGNQKFETFCPLRRIEKRVGKRVVTGLAPFFPSYVFVRFDPAAARWRSINGTIGVLRLVSFGNEPAAMPRGLVERLLELSGPDGELGFDEHLQAGDTVRIVGGPFDALCGQLVTEAPRKRVTILLDLLSGATRVDVERARLISA
jgi:transcriptional antiterminator RfaH